MGWLCDLRTQFLQALLGALGLQGVEISTANGWCICYVFLIGPFGFPQIDEHPYRWDVYHASKTDHGIVRAFPYSGCKEKSTHTLPRTFQAQKAQWVVTFRLLSFS